MINDDFGFANARERCALLLELADQDCSPCYNVIGVDGIICGYAKGLAQPFCFGAGFLKASYCDISKAINCPAFGAQADREFAVILSCHFGFNHGVIIAAVFEQCGQQISIITRTTVYLRGVGFVLFALAQRGKRIELCGNCATYRRIKANDRYGVAKRVRIGIACRFDGFVGGDDWRRTHQIRPFDANIGHWCHRRFRIQYLLIGRGSRLRHSICSARNGEQQQCQNG